VRRKPILKPRSLISGIKIIRKRLSISIGVFYESYNKKHPYSQRKDHIYEQNNDKTDEIEVIFGAYAVIDPRTMMVVNFYATFAIFAVF
jgi:hypothetical protein